MTMFMYLLFIFCNNEPKIRYFVLKSVFVLLQSHIFVQKT